MLSVEKRYLKPRPWSGSLPQKTPAQEYPSGVRPDIRSLPRGFWRDLHQELNLSSTTTSFLVVWPSHREQFLELARQWEEETCIYSADWQIFGHPAYSKIVDMGESVVTFILEILQRDPDYSWCVAISEIVGDNPSVSQDDAGQVHEVSRAWVRWGTDNGYI